MQKNGTCYYSRLPQWGYSDARDGNITSHKRERKLVGMVHFESCFLSKIASNVVFLISLSNDFSNFYEIINFCQIILWNEDF